MFNTHNFAFEANLDSGANTELDVEIGTGGHQLAIDVTVI